MSFDEAKGISHFISTLHDGIILNISKCFLVLKYPEITNLIPKVGQWHGEKVSLSRYFFLVYELSDATPNHFCVCGCLVSPFRISGKFSQPMRVKRYLSSIVTVWVILANPTIRDSAGTMCPRTSVLNSPFDLCWIIWPHPWESQMRPSFRILAARSPYQTSPVLAPDAQINAWFFQFVPYEVRPALLQSVTRGVDRLFTRHFRYDLFIWPVMGKPILWITEVHLL